MGLLFHSGATLLRRRRFALLTTALLLVAGALATAIYQREAASPALSGAAVMLPRTAAAPVAGAQLQAAYAQLPLQFEANRGQSAPQVDYLARGRGYDLFLTSREAVLTLHKVADRPPQAAGATTRTAATASAPAHSLRMRLSGARRAARVAGQEQLAGKVNYLVGNDPARWHTDVPTYARVRYAQVYPGVDLVYYGRQGQLEYDFVVAPHGDPRQIKLSFTGMQAMRLDTGGDLLLRVADVELRQQRPFIYQELDGQRQEVAGAYEIAGRHEVKLRVGDYDPTRPLVIDPVLVYSTYLGGSSSGESGYDIAVDANGNAYVAGETNSPDFPTTSGSYQPAYHSDFGGGTAEAFITKFNAAGSTLIYSTYLGGGNSDYAAGLAIDADGNAYVAGQTVSTNFPTTANAYQPLYNGGFNGGFAAGDAFIAKLNPQGSALLYSTYLGGSSNDGAANIAVDASGNAYVIGGTVSTDFPTRNALRTTLGGDSDAFVAKLDTNASGAASLIYSTYFGGTGPRWFNSFNAGVDSGTAIAVDASGNAYVTGSTESGDFPTTPNALQRSIACDGDNFHSDAFVSKLNTTGNALIYSTYVGGCMTDEGNALALDAAGNIYLTGSTNSANYPVTANVYQPTLHGSGNAFVTKLNADGSALIYSTYLGTILPDTDGFAVAHGIAIDTPGNAYVVGTTNSTFFPQINNLQGPAGSYDAFVAKLNATGQDLIFSTYLGGNGNDGGNAIALDPGSDFYVTGATTSTNFPRANPFQAGRNGQGDAFVSKLHVGDNEPTVSLTGQTLDTNGNPISGVQINLFGSATSRTYSDSTGHYRFSRLRVGGNYELRAYKPCVSFTPFNYVFNNVTTEQTGNFTGSVTTFVISGKVTDSSGAGQSGVTINLTGAQTGQTQTAADGSYSFTLPGCVDYTVTPVRANTTFTPPSRTYTYLSQGQFFASFTAANAPPPPVSPGSVLITEFRLDGPGGASDEFVELYNNTGQPITVGTSDGSNGWLVAARPANSQTITAPITIPNGTVIPAHAHLLAVNNSNNGSGAYSLGAVAAGDISYTVDLPAGGGIALFSTANVNNFSATTRLDAVGFTAADPLYREGAGLQLAGANLAANEQYSYVRKQESGTPQDTGDNAQDFMLVSMSGTVAGAPVILGAPGPENATSPVQNNAQFKTALLDPQQPSSAAPNRVRDTTANNCGGGTNCTLGTLAIRRKFTNKTGQSVTVLRFRIIDITTLHTPNAGSAQADLRALNAGDVTVTTSTGTPVLVKGATLEQAGQALGGGLNSALTVALGGALAPNATINVGFVLGVEAGGSFRFLINVEGLAGGAASASQKRGAATKGGGAAPVPE